MYGKFHDTWEHTLRETSIATAPWYVVEGKDERYRMLTVGKILLAALESVNADARPPPPPAVAPAPSVIGNVALIRNLDLKQRLDEASYERQLRKYQLRLALLTRDKRFRDRSLVLAFEGSDAAGKGGAIRRVTGALDARQYVIVPVAAPTEEERAQPYLWRFWRQVPAKGGHHALRPHLVRPRAGRARRGLLHACRTGCARTTRSTSSRSSSCTRARSCASSGCRSARPSSCAASSCARRRRSSSSRSRPDDWRNRKKWGAYEQAVADMVDRTSTELAPWTLVEAEDKRFGRVKVLRGIVGALERALA